MWEFLMKLMIKDKAILQVRYCHETLLNTYFLIHFIDNFHQYIELNYLCFWEPSFIDTNLFVISFFSTSKLFLLLLYLYQWNQQVFQFFKYQCYSYYLRYSDQQCRETSTDSTNRIWYRFCLLFTNLFVLMTILN